MSVHPPAVPIRTRLVVRGIVQGVGFRPHLARLAAELGLAGACHNDSTGVVAEVEGPAEAVAEFTRRLVDEAPPLARVGSVVPESMAAEGTNGFMIDRSDEGAGARTMVPPDAAVCEDCLREMQDPDDRRFRHPFITCTHCGPRFTITHDLPYDRPTTTMAGFAMCPACRQEYADPADRRFHAQPISCHACGPTLSWATGGSPGRHTGERALAAARASIRAGGIVAVKGIGGYHLVCSATAADAVRRLRQRKHRPHQPFAVMVASLEQAREIVLVPSEAEALLTGTERPIVLLDKAPGSLVADEVAPGLAELGVMVAYTPLHHLLLEEMPPLVATSGNVSGEPLAWRDDDALTRLVPLVDGFLLHDRPIAVPCDDSVVRWSSRGPIMIRRSRGYAPLPIPLEEGPVVLAAGADLKNTFTLARGGAAWMSGHLGDLASLEARTGQSTAVEQMLRFHRAAPELVVADLHPGYASQSWARGLADDLGVPLHLVQHHHAHLASLAAEHGRMGEPLLGLVLDGTGYGCDGGIWGGELLVLGDRGTTARRIGHLAALSLPGGDQGVRNPVRVAAAALAELDVDASWLPGITGDETRLFGAPATWPRTTSAGRLFDVVSALLGVRPRVTYEAQGAVELESVAASTERAIDLPAGEVCDEDGVLVLDHRHWLRHLALSHAPVPVLARSFHAALAAGLRDLAVAGAERTGVATVGLSGGVFANRLLLDLLVPLLEAAGIEVLVHRLVPPGDGGISLGQAAIGLARAQRRG